jgi:hypothetical protein
MKSTKELICITDIREEQELERLMSAKREYYDKEAKLWKTLKEAISVYNCTNHHHTQKFCTCDEMGGEVCKTLQEQAKTRLKEARESYKKKLNALKRKRLKAINAFIAEMEWVRIKRIDLKDNSNSKKELKNV